MKKICLARIANRVSASMENSWLGGKAWVTLTTFV